MNYSTLPECAADRVLGAIRAELAAALAAVFPGGVHVLTRPRAEDEPLKFQVHRVEIVPRAYTPEGQISGTARGGLSLDVVCMWQDPAAKLAADDTAPATVIRLIVVVGKIVAGSTVIRQETYNAAPVVGAAVIIPGDSATVTVTIPVTVELPREDL